VMMTGARPVFADIDPDRLTLDPAATEAAVTTRTRAILPVHLYGQPADMTAIMAVAARHHLAVVEDAAQAHLATSEGRPVGTLGVAGAFSFYPTKNLGALGDGGAVVTNDDERAALVRRLRQYGWSSKYTVTEPRGRNSRLDELQAAVLRARLPLLHRWTERRREIGQEYRRLLHGVSAIEVPPELDAGHVYHLFPVRSSSRDALQARLGAAGVETLIHYPVPIPRQPALTSEHPAGCPVADGVCAEILSLPLYPSLPAEAIARVADALSAA
jgi:dTDP-3-amino-3,4,6-trideoxy-alpha-D-glucose transaminase